MSRKTYYIIAADLTIRMKEWKKDAEDIANYHCGNRFRTRAEADMKMLLECDFIYMLRGWEMSKGAKLEHDVATSCGLKVLDYE